MPTVNWGIGEEVIDDFDRESQFTPYRGPVPPSGAVYQWKITKNVSRAAATREKLPQLRVGLELIPRKGFDEAQFKGYYITAFLSISERTAFMYVPFLDAIGASSNDFINRTVVDEDGKIVRIGRWKNDGRTIILGQLKDDQDQNGNPKKKIGWMGPLDGDPETDDDDTSNEFDEEFEEEEKPKRRSSSRSSSSRQSSQSRRSSRDEDDEEGFDDDEEPRQRRRSTSNRSSSNTRGQSRQRGSEWRDKRETDDDPF